MRAITKKVPAVRIVTGVTTGDPIAIPFIAIKRLRKKERYPIAAQYSEHKGGDVEETT